MIKPIRNQVLVKPFPSEETTEGGLIVPESAQKVNNKVEVISVGGGTKDKPMKLKEGQVGYRVFEWGCPIEINGETHYLLEGDAILAIE